MAVLKCKMCGGNLDVQEGMTVCECEYCGSKQTVPNVDNEKKLNLFSRANRLRAACEYDKAAGVYESIISEFPEEAEAYWGLLLCKFGIEYVDDPKTGKKIPTCHRSSFDSIMEDPDFEMVMENSDPASRAVYREEAKNIERLRIAINEVSSKEEPYDIFICYKETDAMGERTIDSVIAQDVYDALTEKGYKVFFSRISLEDRLGQEYEPYIFAALNSAKIMLVFGTDYEHFNAVWVKNEWSRFLGLMEKGAKKSLIPCYRGIDAYDMPKEFAKLQAQDMGKVGATQDLIRGIDKLMGKGSPTKPEQSQSQTIIQQVSGGGPNVTALITRGKMALEDGKFDDARKYYDQVLNMDAECADAYLGLAMAEHKLHDQKKFAKEYTELLSTLKNDSNVIRAKRFGDEQLNAWFKELDNIRDTAEQEEHERRRRAEEERRIEEKRRAEERRIKGALLAPIRKDLSKYQGLISAGINHSVGLKNDGTVVATQFSFLSTLNFYQSKVSGWRNIKMVSASLQTTIGLRNDGTVIAAGSSVLGQCEVGEWNNITQVCAAMYYTLGLRSNGKVVATGNNSFGRCNVESWENIIKIHATSNHSVGLQSDGKVVAVGDNENGQCDVSEWNDIVDIAAADKHTFGLKSDGTVVVAGPALEEVSEWENIVFISAFGANVAGLKSDGTVVVAGEKKHGHYNALKWKNIVAVSVGPYHILGLKSGGSVVSEGQTDTNRCEVYNWKLF